MDMPEGANVAVPGDYSLIESALSNKGNPTSQGFGNYISIEASQPVRIVDNKGKVLFEGVGPDAARKAVEIGQNLSDTKGNKAGWDIQTVPAGTTTFKTVANEKVNDGLGVVGDVLGVALPIVLSMTPLGPIAGAAAGSFLGSAAKGGDLGDMLKAAGISAATAGALQVTGADKALGSIVNKIPGISEATSALNKAVDGAWNAAFNNAVANGASQEAAKQIASKAADAIIVTALGSGTSNAISGGISSLANSALSNNIPSTYNFDTSAYSNKSLLDQATEAQTSTTPGTGFTLDEYGNVLDRTGAIVVSGLNGATSNAVSGVAGSLLDNAVKQTVEGETPENVLVEGEKKPPVVPPVPPVGPPSPPPPPPPPYKPPPEEIFVDAKEPPPVVPPVPPVGPPSPPPPPPPPPKEEPPKEPPPDKKWTWKDWVRLGLLTPTLIKGLGSLVSSGDETEIITPDQSAVKFNPLNRQRGIGSFDPFTYGQAGPGYQTGEYEFFRPSTPASVTQTSTPATVTTIPGAPTYQYTQDQVDALNKAASDKYAANTASFNAYQDDLARQVESGAMTLDQAIAQANTFGSSLGGIAPVPAADGGYIGYAEGGEMHDDMVKHLLEYKKGGGHNGPGPVKGIGSGQEDKIPAWLSDGEYVWSAQDVADLGDGSTNEGVRRLDKMRQMVRKQAGRKDVKKIAKPQRGIDQMLKSVGGKV
jgi:hypothetical protein